jgi:hypothetical protein
MNPSVKASLLTLAISAMFAPVNGNAAEVPQIIASSAMAHCQSFTPGVTNTIRNRVIGSENTGTKPIGIACAFEVDAGAMTVDGVQSIMLFLNNHGSASFDVSCTAAVGPEGAFSYFISKTTTVDPGVQNAVEFTPADDGSEDVGFGDYLIGLTCVLPPQSIVNDTYVAYSIDNGV